MQLHAPLNSPPQNGAWRWTVAALVATAAAYATNWNFGFLGDARFLLEHNAYMRDPGTLWGQLTHDYFWSSSGNTIPYWRPATKALWLLETWLFGGTASAYHAVSVCWHLGGVAASMALARALGCRNAAVFAAGLLYGLAPVAVEPVSLLMARSDVVAATSSCVAVWAWRVWSEPQDPAHARRTRTGWATLHIAATVVALASKETSVILAPLLLLWAGLRTRFTPRAVGLWRTALPTVALAGLMLALRTLVLADVPGPKMETDAVRVFAGGGRYLLAIAPLQLASGLRNTGYEEATQHMPMVVGSGIAWTVAIAATIVAWRKRDADALGLLLWIAGSLAPVLLVEQLNVPNVEGKFALADRWALQAALASSVLFAYAWPKFAPQKLARPAFAAVTLWALLALVASGVSHGYYATELTLLDREDADFETVPGAFVSDEDRCRALDRSIVRDLAHQRYQKVLADTASTDCPAEILRQFNRLAALAKLKRWSEAEQLADQILAVPSADTRHRAMALHILGQSHLHQGRPRVALRAFHRAQSAGLMNCSLVVDIAHATEVAGLALPLQGPVRAALDACRRLRR